MVCAGPAPFVSRAAPHPDRKPEESKLLLLHAAPHTRLALEVGCNANTAIRSTMRAFAARGSSTKAGERQPSARAQPYAAELLFAAAFRNRSDLAFSSSSGDSRSLFDINLDGLRGRVIRSPSPR